MVTGDDLLSKKKYNNARPTAIYTITDMNRLLLSIFILTFSSIACSNALIDLDVLASVTPHATSTGKPESISIIIFIKSSSQVTAFLQDINQIPNVVAQPLHFMPAILAVIPKSQTVINQIAHHHAIEQISLNKAGTEEMEVSAQAILLAPSNIYPAVNNWWQHGYTGQDGIVGLIDSGVAVEHPGLSNTTIIVRQEPGSEYSNYNHGVRSAHATGVACIYAGAGSEAFPHESGIAYGISTILTGLAGESGSETEKLLLTASTLDWMLTRAPIRPTIINYSYGNGLVSCAACNDWSGLAKVVDHVVNHEKIMWVKSAGNQGIAEQGSKSTMTSPADNYNGITVANMNPTIIENGVAHQTPDRYRHAIRYTSSRGPTLNGRRKPDITAPGNDTRTCAPDAQKYKLYYSPGMDFHDGYRLMGGTSSAAPHVGAAILLLQDANIKNPMAEKALLLNSADAWTDSSKPGPDDPIHPYTGGHYAVMGSEWNPTYGWGYLNMQKAFDQRFNIIEDQLTPNESIKEYKADLPIGGKVTLVHERRVGYNPDSTEWRLSHLSLEIYDQDTHQLIAQDSSPIDTVHQVANCERKLGDKYCSEKTKSVHAIIRVKMLNADVDGSMDEPFAIVFG